MMFTTRTINLDCRAILEVELVFDGPGSGSMSVLEVELEDI